MENTGTGYCTGVDVCRKRELFAETFCNLLQHVADGQVIGAAAFAGAAADAVAGVLGHGVITTLGPVSQTVALQIAVKQEATGNVDAGGTGLAIVAAAAEIGAQLISDFQESGLLFRGDGGGVVDSGQVLFQLLGVSLPGITTVTASLAQM